MGMPSAPKAPPKPAPVTQATSVDELAKKRAELERRKRSGFYGSMQGGKDDNSSTGGGQQTIG